jgi:predicted translin family RNA/ssDNA-binding protein
VSLFIISRRSPCFSLFGDTAGDMAKKKRTHLSLSVNVASTARDGFPEFQKSFDKIAEEMKSYDERRETVIKRAREIQKLSKKAIFSLHRGDTDEAEQRIGNALAVSQELIPLIAGDIRLRSGSYSHAMEEFAEAMLFQHYIKEQKILVPENMGASVNTEEYLGGLLDFTGELNRWAIARATERDVVAVEHAKRIVENIMGCFLQLDLGNGSIRKKYDVLKYTLKNLEKTLYELSLGGQHRDFNVTQGGDGEEHHE